MSHLPLPTHLLEDDAPNALRFLVTRAGLYSINSSVIRDIAFQCKMRPDALSRFIREGYFTPKAAEKVEKGLGRDFIRWEWLVSPTNCVKNGSVY